MKVYQKQKSQLLIRIRISDKLKSVKRIVLCDTTLKEVFDMVEKIIKYNEQFESKSNDTVTIVMRESRGTINGKYKSIKTSLLEVEQIYKLIENEITHNLINKS